MLNTPYTKVYEKITDIDQFFTYNGKTHEMVFTGDSLVVYIPNIGGVIWIRVKRILKDDKDVKTCTSLSSFKILFILIQITTQE